MKIADLARVWDSRPRIVRADYNAEIAHIVTRNGEKKDKYHVYSFSITNCKRLMKWPTEVRDSRYLRFRLCARCGDQEAFEDTVERGKKWEAEWNAKRDRERAMEEAEFKVAKNWDETWEKLEASMLDDLELMVESGTVLIPIKKADLAWLRSQLSRMIKRLDTADELKSESEVEAWHRADHLLNNVLISD